jgi:hypothetical protein
MDGLIMKYFVLKPKGTDAYAEASRDAMWHYAHRIEKENRKLARQLLRWVWEERKQALIEGGVNGVDDDGHSTRS